MNIEAVFKQPFDEQVAFFRGKLGNLIPTETWTDVWQSAHDTGFMVAGAAKADLLADLAAAVDSAISEGTGIQAFRKNFDAIVEKHGWSYRGEYNWRTRTIYRTNMATSYSAGRLVQLKEGGFEYWMYRHSDSVARPRPLHVSWNGLTLPADDGWWDSHYPPNGWSCFPPETEVRCDAVIGLKTWYSGEMVELYTALGHRLTVTANHPVLTGRGWVSAGMLDEGDELIGAIGDVDAELVGVVNHEQPPSRAEDLFESLAAKGLRVVPMSPDDFHGDALCRKPEIHVAGAYGALMDIVDAKIGEDVRKGGFDSALHRSVESTHVSIGSAQTPFVVNNAILAKNPTHGRLGNSKSGGYLPLAGESAPVKRENFALDDIVPCVGNSPGIPELSLNAAGRALDFFPAQNFGLGSVSQSDACETQGSTESATAASRLFGELLEANPGTVACDEVIKIRKFQWAGHVYDFVTSTGLIIAGGLTVSNCHCYVIGVSGASAKRLGGRIQPAPDDGTTPDGRPNGIDKGWDYQPGATTVDQVRKSLSEKLPGLPKPLSESLKKDLEK